MVMELISASLLAKGGFLRFRSSGCWSHVPANAEAD